MNAITICVNFGDLLAVTLPRNAIHFDRVLVVSDHADEETASVVASVSNAKLLKTNAFYQDGARLNKGAAMESGLDLLGRTGWLCILDADTVLPPDAPLDDAFRHTGSGWLEPGNLYCPQRRMLYDVTLAQHFGLIDWNALPLHADEEWAGYCQIFHAADPVLAGRKNWYGVDWSHAGGCDSDFQMLWSRKKKLRPPFEVVHIGQDGQNWCGRATQRVDGTMPRGADENAAAMRRLMEERRARRGAGHERIGG